MKIQTIKLSCEEVEAIQKLLNIEDADLRNAGHDIDSAVIIYTAKFGNGIEADIKLCSGDRNYFIDPVLFKDDSEVNVLDVEDEILGDYLFEHDGNEYKVIIEVDFSKEKPAYLAIPDVLERED